jgi:hypothetical protein
MTQPSEVGELNSEQQLSDKRVLVGFILDGTFDGFKPSAVGVWCDPTARQQLVCVIRQQASSATILSQQVRNTYTIRLVPIFESAGFVQRANREG